jgi:N4-gp56 family major capsid protein
MGAHAVIFETNDASTRKKWAKELFHGLLRAIEFNDLIGTGTDAIVQLRNDLGKGEGDEITFTIRYPLTGQGIVGQDTVEGNEEKMLTKNFKFTIEELNHAVDTGGKMDEQRVPWNLLQEGKDGLQYWWADKLSDYIMAVLCGDSTFTIAGKSFATACEEPDDQHLVTVNDVATEAAMTAADMMDLSFLDRMKQLAEVPRYDLGCYKLRPLIIGGKKYYRVILHNYVYDRLKQNMNPGQFGDLLRAASKLNLSNVEFEYNGLLVSKSERIRTTTTGVYRNLLLGSQAACFAWGGAGESKSSTMAFVPYEKDAKRFLMVRGGGIFGARKVGFTPFATRRDFGVIVGKSYATKL